MSEVVAPAGAELRAFAEQSNAWPFEDAHTYRNDCNRSVIFYYCVVDPPRSEVAPCRRILPGMHVQRIHVQAQDLRPRQGQTGLGQARHRTQARGR